MKRIAIIGTGYVGLVTGTCFAELGNAVVCLDNDVRKIDMLRAGQAPFYEPQLLEMIVRNSDAGRLRFSDDVAEGVRDSEIVFIAVGTPMGADGHADLSAVRAVAASIGRALNGPKIVVSKSTVPVETGEMISSIIGENSTADYHVDVVSNPEFLREGSAVADFMHPDRVVVGVGSREAEEAMRELYRSLDAPMVVTDVRTSEMVKYAANAFLATKISFMNEIANICDLVGVDVKTVGHGIGFDHRIGTQFMNPGIGYGGSCFPKDVRALEKIAAERDYDAVLLRAVEAVNQRQFDGTFDKVLRALDGDASGKRVGVLGLSFKPNTDDIREAPALHVIDRLLQHGATLHVHDPIAVDAVRAQFGDRLNYCEQIYEVAHDADVMLLATEWNEYKNIDFTIIRKLMRGSTVIDGRNIFDASKVAEAGLRYVGIGRSRLAATAAPVAST